MPLSPFCHGMGALPLAMKESRCTLTERLSYPRKPEDSTVDVNRIIAGSFKMFTLVSI